MLDDPMLAADAGRLAKGTNVEVLCYRLRVLIRGHQPEKPDVAGSQQALVQFYRTEFPASFASASETPEAELIREAIRVLKSARRPVSHLDVDGDVLWEFIADPSE
jgi:hypothetical protein